VALLFAKFKAIWGQRWTTQFQTAESLDLTRAEWADAIGTLSAEELRRGITTCRDSLQWPPSIAEFLAAAHQGHEHRTAAYRAMDPGTLHRDEDPDRASTRQATTMDSGPTRAGLPRRDLPWVARGRDPP